MKTRVCKKHREKPAIIYGKCIGCEIDRLRLEVQSLRAEKRRAGVLDAIEEYFSDTSRSAEETRAGLEAIREHLGILIDTLPESDMDYEG